MLQKWDKTRSYFWRPRFSWKLTACPLRLVFPRLKLVLSFVCSCQCSMPSWVQFSRERRQPTTSPSILFSKSRYPHEITLTSKRSTHRDCSVCHDITVHQACGWPRHCSTMSWLRLTSSQLQCRTVVSDTSSRSHYRSDPVQVQSTGN